MGINSTKKPFRQRALIASQMKTDSLISFFAQNLRCTLLFIAILDLAIYGRGFSGERLPNYDSCDCRVRTLSVPPNGKVIRNSEQDKETLSAKTFKLSNNVQPIVVDTIFTNIPNPSGICSDGESFWVPNYAAASGNTEIYRIDIRSRCIADSIPSPDQWTTGMAWDGSSLWVTGVDFSLPPPQSCLKKLSTKGQILGYYQSDYSCYWDGIAWDGTYLYYGTNTCSVYESRQTSMIFKASHDNGTIVDSIAPPSGNINGLVYDRGFFWYCDLLAGMIYKITVDGNIVTSFPTPGGYASGLAIAKGFLWNIDFQTNCIYQIDIGLAPPSPKSLTGRIADSCVDLQWGFSTASNLVQYKIYRGSSEYAQEAVCIDSVSSFQLSFTDRHVVRGMMWYWVSAVDSAGLESHVSKPVSIQVLPLLPTSFSLEQNFPNPFNSSTEIRFGLPVATTATLIVYDAIGRVMATLVSRRLSAGEYSYIWDASRMPSGVYFYHLRTESFSQTKKIVMIK